MDVPSTVTGTWIALGIAVALVFVVFTQTLLGAVLGVVLVTIAWYFLGVLGYRADRRMRKGGWRE